MLNAGVNDYIRHDRSRLADGYPQVVVTYEMIFRDRAVENSAEGVSCDFQFHFLEEFTNLLKLLRGDGQIISRRNQDPHSISGREELWFNKNLEEKLGQNIVKEIREELLMSKAELARKAGVSPLTIDRIEKGKSCRMETRRKIILALGYKLSDKDRIFPESLR